MKKNLRKQYAQLWSQFLAEPDPRKRSRISKRAYRIFQQLGRGRR